MPVVLILAFAASLGLHVAVLFGPQFELPVEVETTALTAELKPAPLPPAQLAPPPPPPQKKPVKAPRRKVERLASASPVLSVPGPSPRSTPDHAGPAASASAAEPAVPDPPAAEAASAEPAPVSPRLPPRGMIRYRVDRGDSNFEIGFAEHQWTIADGHYRLTSLVETTGLVWLFKSIRIEMESRGLITAQGLRPQSFAIVRNGQASRETAFFDWQAMTVRVADQGEQPLDEGAQDLLSFNYQLGFVDHLAAGSTLYLATGKKYGVYHLEVLGDEDLELPAGAMRTLHLRAPGTNTTELWLAYDYLLLPVKIRHVDAKGDSFVQVATTIRVGDESDPKRDDASPR